MQAKGIFYITDCSREEEEESGKAYLKLDVTEVVENKLCAMDLGNGNFRCLYRGDGMEAGNFYELSLDISIRSNCSFTAEVLGYRLIQNEL